MAIYCMSGTGNSYYVGKRIAEALNLILRNGLNIHTNDGAIIMDNDDYVGFVFPIYDFKASKVFLKQIQKIKVSQSAYVFAVATYGVGTLSTYKNFTSEMESCGKRIDGGFAVFMPHNAVGSGGLSDEDIYKILNLSEKDLESVIKWVKNREKGDHMSTKAFDLLKSKYARKMIPAVISLMKALIFHGADSLKFQVDDNCVECGLCSRVCPAHNINRVDGVPKFGDNCINCFACIQWCDKIAISFGGKRLGLRKYTHPKVEAREMIEFNGNKETL